MTPKQRIELQVGRQAEQVAALATWCEAEARGGRAPRSDLTEALSHLNHRLAAIAEAAAAPPCIGVTGLGGPGRDRLVDALLAPAIDAGTPMHPASTGQLVHRSLIGALSRHGAVNAMRFTSVHEASRVAGYPFTLSLLSLGDLVVIAVRIYYTCCPAAHTHLVDRARLAAVYEDVGRNLTTVSIAGLTDQDVHRLRDRLTALYPQALGLKALAATGYWEDLAGAARHLPLQQRVSALSLLWAEQPQITDLFHRLAETLAQVSYSQEMYCPREALLQQSGETGWPVAHPRSVLDGATLRDFYTEADEPLPLVSRFGTRVTVTRSRLAAIAADVVVPVSGAAVAEAAGADLLVLPGLPQPPPLAMRIEHSGQRSWYFAPPTLLAAYAKCKALHLVSRAATLHRLTSLVLAVDPDDDDDVLASAVADWVDDAQGATPQQREYSQPALFVVATHGVGRGSDTTRGVDGAAEGEAGQWGRRLQRALADTVSGGDGWLPEWVPRQRFANVFVFAHPDEPLWPDLPGSTLPALLPRSIGGELLQALSPLGVAPRSYARDPDRIARALASADGGARLVAQALGAVSGEAQHLRQLQAVTHGVGRTIASLVAHHGTVDELPDSVEWRQQMAIVLAHRLQRSSEDGRLGELLSALMVTGPELGAVFARDRGRWSGEAASRQRALILNDGGAAHTHVGEFARRLTPPDRIWLEALAADSLDMWGAQIVRGARSGRLCRALGLTGPMLAHVAGEVVAGARRLRLQTWLLEVLATNLGTTAPKASEQVFINVAALSINGFVEQLAVPGGNVVAAAAPLASVWSERFLALVEGNLRPVRGAHTGLDPELARTLGQSINFGFEGGL